jgi:hypothetical protein
MLRRYSRLDPRGGFPARPDQPDLTASRLAAFWRPLIDGTDSELAANRLRAIPVIGRVLVRTDSDEWPWLSTIGVPGLRSQVLRHAGLDYLDCQTAEELPERYWTPQWAHLVEAIHRFDVLSDRCRALLIFQLAQLSFCQQAVRLGESVRPAGDGGSSPAGDRYALEVARITARFPDRVADALRAFGYLAEHAEDPVTRLAGCFQGIGHCLHGKRDPAEAAAFERIGRAIQPELPAGWQADLVRSRYCRAVSLLHRSRSEPRAAWSQLEASERYAAALPAAPTDAQQGWVIAENRRYLLELRTLLALDSGDRPIARDALQSLEVLDPYCVEARLFLGDGYFELADYPRAAHWYGLAGELGTGAGAMGWFRAGQCYDLAGERAAAAHAMGRCLELDSTAVEPREYLCGRFRVTARKTTHAHRAVGLRREHRPA